MNLTGTETVLNPDQNTLKDILSIIRASFPAGWEYDDAGEYYTRMLKEKSSIHIFLKAGEAGEKRAGYLHAIPHNAAVAELKDDDPLTRAEEGHAGTYYIEIVGILPEYRGKNGFSILLEALKKELQKKGITKISIHARVSNNLSMAVQRKLKAAKVRRIENWAYYNRLEPTDYIEAEW